MLSTLPMEANLGHWQGYELGVWNLWPLNLRHLGTDAAGQNIWKPRGASLQVSHRVSAAQSSRVTDIIL